MIKSLNKLLFFLISISYMTLVFGTVDEKEIKRFEEAHLMAVASLCAYLIGTLERGEIKISDKKNIEKCFVDNKVPHTVTYIDSFIASSRLGIDAFYWAETTNEIILAFRGTLPPPTIKNKVDDYYALMQIKYDWLNDTDIILTTSPPGRHQGFNSSWEILKNNLDTTLDLYDRLRGRAIDKKTIENLEKQVKNIQRKVDSGKKLLITGHSKGAALATLAALDIAKGDVADLRTPATNIYLYTFEGPRVFNSAGVDEFNKIMVKENHWRFEYGNDIVPHLPPGVSGVGEKIEFSETQIKTISTFINLANFNIKDIKWDYMNVGELKYCDNANSCILASENDELNSRRLKNLGMTFLPHEIPEGVGTAALKFGSAILSGHPLYSPEVIKLKEDLFDSVNINFSTLISDHYLTHWIEYFKRKQYLQ